MITHLKFHVLWLYCYLRAWGHAINVLYENFCQLTGAISPGSRRSPLRAVQLIHIARLFLRWTAELLLRVRHIVLHMLHQCIRLGRHLLRVIRKFGTLFARIPANHHRIISQADYMFFERLRKHASPNVALQFYVRRLGHCSADEVSGVLALALQCREYGVADKCFEELFRRFPLAIETHRSAAVRCFLQEEYSYAEKVWTQSEENRETEFRARGLDSHQTRYLGPSWFIAIGHIAHLDTLFKHRLLKDAAPANYVSIVPAQLKIPNQYFLNLWKPFLTPIEGLTVPNLPLSDVVILQDEFWSLRVSQGQTFIYSKAGSAVQRAWQAGNRSPLLTLPDADVQRGWKVLEELGVPRGAWFVCLHVREPGFHKAWHETNPGTRNADPRTYLAAVEAIVSRGGFVVRMGDNSMLPMPLIHGLIDYAHSDAKADWMDIFLCAQCRFFLGTNSGLGLIPPVFGVPCAMTNWSPIAIPQWYPDDLFIPKMVRSVSENRLLTFEEMLTTNAGWAQFETYFRENGLEVIDNSPEEIRELAIEMLDRLSGRIACNDDDILRLSCFENLSKEFAGYVGSRMGRDFLRKYASLLPSVLQVCGQERCKSCL